MDGIKFFKALGDENRLKILILLSRKNICAKGIASRLNISEPAVSQHVKVLKDADIIVGYKKGYHVVYEINRDVLNDAISFMNSLMNLNSSTVNNFGISIADFETLPCMKGCRKVKKCCSNDNRDELNLKEDLR